MHLRELLLNGEPEEQIQVPWWLRVILACLGGTCVFLSFPDYNLFFLAWIALALEL